MYVPARLTAPHATNRNRLSTRPIPRSPQKNEVYTYKEKSASLLVETVSDGHIFDHIDGVQDVAASGRDSDLNPRFPAALAFHLYSLRRSQLHLGAQPADFLQFDLRQGRQATTRKRE